MRYKNPVSAGRKAFLILITGLFTAAGISARGAEFEPVIIDFSSPDVGESVYTAGRFSIRGDAGIIQLRGGSAVVSRAITGPGYYHFRFTLREPENFEYHQSRIFLFLADPKELTESPMRLTDAYSLTWLPSGLISGRVVSPGRDNPYRYQPGDYVDITLKVPAEGNVVYVYGHSENTAGEPTTGFRIGENVPSQGHFGAYNSKWFSTMELKMMRYRPLEEE